MTFGTIVKRISLGAGTLISVCVIGAYIFNHDQSLARASDVLKVREEIKMIHQRYQDDRQARRAESVQERIWVLDERYSGKQMPLSVKEEYRSLQAELRKLRLAGF